MSAVQTEQSRLVPAGTWSVDPVHSKVGFEVLSLEDHVAAISGRFTDFEGALEGDPQRAEGIVRTASVATDNEQRDADVRSADLLDVERFPEIRFRSTAIEHLEGDRYAIRGELTIKDEPIPVELDARLRGSGTDRWGAERFAFHVDGAIEWGPTRVELTVEVSAVRQ